MLRFTDYLVNRSTQFSMDRRTLIFVISLSLTLLAVNTLFERWNVQSLSEKREQEKTKNVQMLASMEKEIQDQTASVKDLPLANLYADEKSKEFLTSGVLIKNSILTLSWKDPLPTKVYVQGVAYQLVYSPKELNAPALYEKSPQDKLAIGHLSYFGHFDLQLVTFHPGEAGQPPSVALAKYTDGQFSVPAAKLLQLSLEAEKETPIRYPLPGNSIALLKTPEGYLPVAAYNASEKAYTFLEQVIDLNAEVVKPQLPPEKEGAAEEFYVLENQYQQLVFSSRGGALIGINLPFQSEAHPNSVVKEIDFDREIVADHPYNAMFPEHPYFTPGTTPEGPYVENPKGTLGGYYPLLRRDLIQTGKRKSMRVLPQFYGLNIISEYPEMAEQNYKVTYFDKNKITFEAVQRNRRITKTFTLKEEEVEAPYCFYLNISLEGESRGLWLTTGVPEVEWISNAPAPALKYRITRNGKSEVVNLDKPKEAITISSLYPDWICNSNGFFGIILDPLKEIDPGLKAQTVPGTVDPTRLVQIDEEYDRFKAQDLPGYMMMLPLSSQGGQMTFRIFAGPFASKTLKAVDAIFSNAATGYNPDYLASQTFHGWFAFISAPFAKFLFILMQFFHYLTGSWAFSIILLTVALRIMLYPLNAWSTKSMLRMQQIAPEVQKIQEKYKKDPKKAQLEVMNLYRDRGVNPVSGCFPLLIQMPFLIGMFDLLKSTFELRGASFIPGWIDNLAAPDVLFSWNAPLFFIGNQFHLLPFLLGGVMYLQQKTMSTLPKDPSQMTEQQRQQKMMGTMMTVLFTVMFYNFPSGLNIYWLSSMLLGILQQWWTQKSLKAAPAKATVVRR